MKDLKRSAARIAFGGERALGLRLDAEYRVSTYGSTP